MECAKTSEIDHLPRRFISNKEQVDNEIYHEITTDRTDGYMVPTQNVFSDHFKPESNEKRNISSWTRNYRQLVFGIVGGCLLTLLIVVPAVYFSANSNSPTKIKESHFPLKFDKSTLHQSVFMSEDGLKISNTYSRDTPLSALKNPNTLSTYKGVIGNRCFDRNSKRYFEVQYELTVIGKWDPADLLFEVGIADYERVDNYHFVGTARTRGWSYRLYICGDTDNNTCLSAQHAPDDVYTVFPIHHQVSYGSKHSGKLRFVVNTSQETFSLIRNSSTGTLTIHSLQNVFSVQRLCPVFAVYNSGTYEVKLSLVNTYDISEAIWNIVIL